MRLPRNPFHSRSRSAILLASAACVGVAALVLAHDEDWRKLRDRQPPVHAQPFRAAVDPGGPGVADGFESQNVSLLSWIPLNAFPNSQGNASDCWGYVSPSGREYAIIGLQKGFGVVEVTNPANAQIIGYIPGATSTWHDVKVHGSYAYGVSEGGLGIQVIDLSQVDSGVVSLVQNVTQGGHTTTHNIAVNNDSGFLYLCGANVSNGGLVAVSTANPTQPTIAGAWSTRYVHDAQVVTYTSGPYAGREIAFCANGGAGLDVVDVTNKSNMFRIGGTGYPNLAYAHQCWLSDDKQYLYLNDELDEQNFGTNTTTRIIDVSNPAQPVLVGTFSSGLPSIDHNLYVRGNLIFEANYRSGLRIFDATTPTAPAQVGYFDTHPGSNAPGFNGAWSCYPLFPSETVLISDIERGLFVVRYEVGSLTFQFPVGLPTNVTPNTATPVTVKVVEDQVTLQAGTVRLYSRANSAPFSSVVMTPTGVTGEFTASLPGTPCLDVLDFYFSAQTTDGRTYTSPATAPGAYHTAVSASSFTTVVDLNFETDPGWAVANDPSLTSGAWERAVPHTPPSTNCPSGDFDGSGRCWVTDNRSGNFDVDGGPTTLTTSAFDLSGYGSARLSYARWISSTNGAVDSLEVHVSSNNGQTWVPLEVAAPNGSWTLMEFDIGSVVSLTSQFRVRFRVSDNPNNSLTEAGVDRFRIVGVDCAAACYADCNGDGALNLADFGCFQTKFATNDPYADCNGDGQLNLADFGCFQTKFALGCP